MGSFTVSPAAVKRATVEAAVPFFTRFGERAKANAAGRCNVATGALVGSLYSELINGGLGARIGARAPYALYVHEGTGPHLILPRPPRRFLRFTAAGGVVFAREVRHPGYRGNAFLRDGAIAALRG